MALDAGTAFVDIQPQVGSGFFATLKGSLGGGKMKALGLAAGAGLAAGVAGAFAAFKIGETFDEAFDTIRVGTGATGDTLEGLKDDFKEVFASVPTDAAAAGTAIADLNTLTGATGEPLQNLAEQFLELSRITGTDLQGNIASVTRVFGDWGVAVDDQAGALDYLFRTSQATGATVGELSDNIVKYGAPLRNLGYDIEESAALFGKWNKEGVNTETIFGGLRMAVGNFAKEGKNVPDAFREAIDSISEAADASEATAIAMEIFGTRAGPDLADAIRGGKFELDDLVGTLQGGEETIVGVGEETQSFGEKWQKFVNRVLVAVEPIATRVFDALGTAFDVIGPKVGPVIDTIGRLASTISEYLAPAVQVVGDIFKTVAGLFSTTGDDAERFAGRWAAIWEAVQGALASAQEYVETVIAAIQAFWEKYGDRILEHVRVVWGAIQRVIEGTLKIIKGVFDVFIAIFKGDWRKAWDGIKSILSGVLDIIIGLWEAFWSAVKLAFTLARDFIVEVWQRLWGSVVSAVSTAFETVVGWVQDIYDGVTGWFSDMYDSVTGFWADLWDDVTSGAETAWDTFIGWIEGVWETFYGWWEDVWDTLSGAVSAAMDGVTGAVRTVFNSVISVIERGINSAIKGVNGAIRGLNIINPFKDIPYVPEISLPRLARGGIIDVAGDAIVGEEGPERVYLPRGAEVRPLPRDLRDVGARQQTITVVLDGRQIARAIGDPLMDEVIVRTGARRI